MATANTTAVKIALEGVIEAERAIKRLGPTGEAALEQLRSGAAKASVALGGIDKAANQNLGGFKRYTEGIRSAGYQFGDFAVQVQSGTNVVVAATQQLSQFAGSFGVVGAAVGGALAIGGAFVSYLTRQNEAADEASEAVDNFAKSMSESKDAANKYKEELNGLTGASLELFEILSELESKKIKIQIEADIQPIREDLARQFREQFMEAQRPKGGVAVGGTEEFLRGQQVQEELFTKLTGENADAITGLKDLEDQMKAGNAEAALYLAKHLGILTEEFADTIEKTVASANRLKELQGIAAEPSQLLLYPNEAKDREAIARVAKDIQDLQDKMAIQSAATRPSQLLLYPKTETETQFEKGATQDIQATAQKLTLLKQEAVATSNLAKAAGESALAQRLANIESKKQQDLLRNSADFKGELLKQANEATEAIARNAKAEASAAAARESSAKGSREAERQLEIAAAIEEKLEAAKRDNEAVGQGAYALKLADIERAKHMALLKAEKDLTGELLEAKKKDIEETARIERQTASKSVPVPTSEHKDPGSLIAQERMKSEKEVADYHLERVRDTVAKQEKLEDTAAKRRARLLESQFEHMADVVTDTVAEGLQQAFDGEFDFSKLTESFGDAFSKTITQSLSIALTAPLNEAAKGFSQKLMASMGAGEKGAPGVSTLTGTEAAFAGAAGGYAAGGIYGQVAGLKPGNQAALGGTIGGALGAGAGLYFSGGNPYVAAAGGVVGAAAGSFAGGLFGGENNLGNDRSAQAYRAGRGITYSDTSFSQENRDITQGILTEIQTLEEAFVDLGGVVGDVRLRIEAGTKTGITVDGKKYPDAQSALVASIEKLIGQTTGLSATQQTILANTKGGTAAEIGQDLAFGEQYDQLVFNGREVDRVLEDLNKQFAAAARQAAELGLNTDLLAVAHQKAAAAVAEQYEAERAALRNQLESVGGDSVALQFKALEVQFADLAKAAANLNVPLEEVAAAHVRAAAMLEQEIKSQQSSLALQIAQLGGDDSAATQLFALNVQVQELARQAIALGMPLDALAAAHEAAAKRIIEANQAITKEVINDQQRRGVLGRIAQARGDTSVETQLFMLETEMRELAKAAAEVGIPLSEVTKAHKLAAQNIIEAAQQIAEQGSLAVRSLFERIAQASGDKTLVTQLHILETQMQSLAAEAKAAGIPLKTVTDAHKKAASEIRRQYDQSLRGAQEQVAAARGDNSLATQLHVLETRMRDLAKAATDLGIPMSEVTKAHKLAAAEVERQFEQTKRGVQEQIATARGDKSLTAQLFGLETQMRELAKAATDLGIPLAEVTKAHETAAAKLKEAYARSQEGLRLELRGFGAANDNDVGFALAQLALQFKELEDRAKDLQIPLKDVTEAHKRAADEIIQADKEMRAKFLRDIGLIDATDLDRELAGIRDRFKELIEQAVDLGYATDGLRKSQAKAEADAIEAARKRLTETERSLAGAQRDVFDQIGQYLDPIKQLLGPTGVGQGIFSGGATAKDTLGEFRKTLALARGGDVGALQSIGGIGQSAIQAARAFGASGTQASSAFREVTEGFREIQGELEEKRTALIKQGLDYQKLTLDEQIRQRVEVVTELRELRAELKRSLDMSRQRQVS